MVKLETLVNEIKDKNLKDSSFQLYYYNGLETCNCIISLNMQAGNLYEQTHI